MANLNEAINVKVLKYDGTEHRSWAGAIVRRDGPLIVIEAVFEFDVHHDLIGHIARGTRTVEYYWLDRWYNIFRFLETDGTTRLCYCNVNTPPKLCKEVLSYIDLDIDILVQPDLSYRILDLEEFAVNSERYQYADATKANARRAVDELVSMIESRREPFCKQT